MKNKGLEERLLDPTPENMRAAYKLVKDVPFPVDMPFSFMLKDGNEFRLHYRCITEEHPAYKQDLIRSMRYFYTDARVFSKRRQPELTDGAAIAADVQAKAGLDRQNSLIEYSI